jgi:hypothetical protein
MEELTTVIFPSKYTYEEIDELKKSCVDMLIFDSDFNGDLLSFEFPDTILCLVIRSNVSLSNVKLPKYLKVLKFGNYFDQLLDNTKIPDSVEIIEFTNYKHSLTNVILPKNIKKIKNIFVDYTGGFSDDKYHSLYALPYFLPKNIKVLNLGYEYNYNVNFFIVPKKLIVFLPR